MGVPTNLEAITALWQYLGQAPANEGMRQPFLLGTGRTLGNEAYKWGPELLDEYRNI